MEEQEKLIYIDVEYKKHEPHYDRRFIAINRELGLITEASTFEKLLENLQDAIHLNREYLNLGSDNLPQTTRIIIRMELGYETPARIEGD